MNSARLAVVGILAALFTVLGAGAAQAYPDPTIKISVGDDRFVGGLPLNYSVSSGGVECDFVVTFNGERQTGFGTSFSGTFATPKVSAETPLPITATCTYDNFDSTGAVSDASAGDSAIVTLLPLGADITPAAAGDSGGILPNTGGSNLWILVVGGALVLIGGGAFVVARRR